LHGAFYLAWYYVALVMAIVKILSRHSPSYGSLIRYILNEGKTDPLEAITHNLRSDDIESLVKEFAENESFRKQSRSDQVYLFHEIISFNANEDATALTSAIINDIANEYIRLRGIEGVLLGAVHRDKEHVHVHFCVSALKFRTGTSFGLSKATLRELKIQIQDFHRQKYPEISQSFPQHGIGRPYLKDRTWQATHRAERAELKEQIAGTVRSCFEKATSQKEFLELLRVEDFHYYERDGVPTGIEHDGIKFRFSRLLEAGQFETLPLDLQEEDKVLADIRSIREQRGEKDREDRDYDDGMDIAR
jgi:hypothetical protein